MKKHLFLNALLVACVPVVASADIDLEKIVLPEGFSIEIYAENVDNARQMARGENGTIFVGSRKKGRLYAVVDDDGDNRADRVLQLDDGLDLPSGVEFRGGALYVGALNRILKYEFIESRLDDPPNPVVVTSALPDEKHHGWKYLRFGPDGKLYIPVGVPCNICQRDGFGQIRRLNISTGAMEVYAMGVRNSVGLAFHPVTGELWFTDNGRDMLGDDLPSCELNHAPQAGMHFGFPYCHQGDTLDSEFGQGKDCADYTPPAAKLGAHVAPLGLAFYTGEMFPQEYRNQLFIAEHGSWNRSDKIGYRIKLVRFDDAGNVTGQEVFARGWLLGQSDWGRPNDILVMPDGALLVSDDSADVIYRITYQPKG